MGDTVVQILGPRWLVEVDLKGLEVALMKLLVDPYFLCRKVEGQLLMKAT